MARLVERRVSYDRDVAAISRLRRALALDPDHPHRATIAALCDLVTALLTTPPEISGALLGPWLARLASEHGDSKTRDEAQEETQHEGHDAGAPREKVG